MKKIFIATLFIFALCAVLATPVLAATRITFDGTPLHFNLPVVIRNDRSFFPMRELLTALGAEVSWDAEADVAVAEFGGNRVGFPVGSSAFFVNGKRQEMANAASFIESGRTYIPVRYAAEGLGFDVGWDAETSTILITTSRPQSDADLDLGGVSPVTYILERYGDSGMIAVYVQADGITVYTFDFTDSRADDASPLNVMAYINAIFAHGNFENITLTHMTDTVWHAMLPPQASGVARHFSGFEKDGVKAVYIVNGGYVEHMDAFVVIGM